MSVTVSFTLPQPLSEIDEEQRLNLLASFAEFLNLPKQIREGRIEITVQNSKMTRSHAHYARDVKLIPMQ